MDKVKINAKDGNTSYQIAWDSFWRIFYGHYRNNRITYMMHQVTNAVAAARRAELHKAPRFAVCRRAERDVRW